MKFLIKTLVVSTLLALPTVVAVGQDDAPAPVAFSLSDAALPDSSPSDTDLDLDAVFVSHEGKGGGCTDKSGGCDGKGGFCNDSCGCDSGLLGFGLVKRTSNCFSGFITPMTNPVFFEDPRIETNAKLIFVQQRLPLAAGGQDVQLIGLQFQLALSDRLSLVADKDGYIISQNPLIDDGWADVALGLKYNLFADYERQRLVSAGFSYELPVGSTRSLQGNGDGEFHLYVSAAAQLGCDWHWMTGAGLRIPTDSTDESQMAYWSNHLDRQISDRLYLFGEVNWYHWMKSGGQPALAGVEGGDLFNLGSTAVAGNDIVTGAVGIKYRPRTNMEIGFAWEAPLTDRRDVLDNRLTVDAILKY